MLREDRLYGDTATVEVTANLLDRKTTLLRSEATVGPHPEWHTTVHRASGAQLGVDVSGDTLRLVIDNPTGAPVLAPGTLTIHLTGLDWRGRPHGVTGFTTLSDGLDATTSFRADRLTVKLETVAYAPGTSEASFRIESEGPIRRRVAAVAPTALALVSAVLLLGLFSIVRSRNARIRT